MRLVNATQLAAKLYLKEAYAQSVPDAMQQKMAALQSFELRDAMLAWDGFEREGGRYALRLGNDHYPHMKLVLQLAEGGPLFYVDAHDSHFDVAPETSGYRELVALRKQNKGLKRRIEGAWSQAKLPVFGRVKAAVQSDHVSNLRVLVIDDEDKILDMMGMIVHSVGADYLRADSVAAAERQIVEHKPDLVFCDIMMPDQSGYDFVAHLQSRSPDTPIYYITGMVLDQVDRAGVTDVLQKPFSPKRVIDIIRREAERRPT